MLTTMSTLYLYFFYKLRFDDCNSVVGYFVAKFFYL